MDQVLEDVVTGFSEYLNQNKPIFKKNIGNNRLISFSTEFKIDLSDIDLNSIRKNYERSFYFEKPSEGIKFLGLNEILAITEKGIGRFAATEKKISLLKENFVCNWDEKQKESFPLFLGAMKFNVEHTDEDWKEYDDSLWFVPELLFIQIGEESYLIHNVLTSSTFSDKVLSERLHLKLENFKNTAEIKKDISSPKVRYIIGNEPKDKKKWKNIVNSALEEIQNNTINKVVLSRRIEIQLFEEMNLNLAREKLTINYPDCSFFIYSTGKYSFFGATPEKMVKFTGDKLICDVLAGSAPRGDNESEDEKLEKEFLMSEKNIKEHEFVIDDIKNSLSKHAEIDQNDFKSILTVKKFKYIQHLYSNITAQINSGHSMFHLLGEIFPTSAVCGVPRTEALNLIKKLETHKRGLYSGITGWFNFENFGEFMVAIRSAVSYNHKVAAFAGAGIVSDSQPDEEFKETELKLKPVLSIFTNED
jgi:menaquinone-specific isochorismate synthase